jgi:glutamine cyclotransferase
VRRIALALFAGVLLAQTKASTPVYGYQVVNRYPHDRGAFTEGLFVLDGDFYEGTGLEGKSNVRRVDIATGRVKQQYNIPPQYFGEGIVAFGKQLFQLTYKSGVAFVYDRSTFQLLKTYKYAGEGWGMTTDGKRLIMSDGTSQLRFLDPATFKETGRLSVTDGGRPIDQLNELEWIKGEIWANIWLTQRIARIDAQTGRVNSWLDMSGILSVMEAAGTDAMNGIAYDAKTDRIFVTGKWWPRVFEIKVGARK